MIKTKKLSDMFSYFQSFVKMICMKYDAKVNIRRTNNGIEYMDGGFRYYLESLIR